MWRCRIASCLYILEILGCYGIQVQSAYIRKMEFVQTRSFIYLMAVHIKVSLIDLLDWDPWADHRSHNHRKEALHMTQGEPSAPVKSSLMQRIPAPNKKCFVSAPIIVSQTVVISNGQYTSLGLVQVTALLSALPYHMECRYRRDELSSLSSVTIQKPM